MSSEDVVNTSTFHADSLKQLSNDLAIHITPEDKVLSCLKMPFGEFKNNFRTMCYLNITTTKRYIMLEKFIVCHCIRSETTAADHCMRTRGLSEKGHDHRDRSQK